MIYVAELLERYLRASRDKELTVLACSVPGGMAFESGICDNGYYSGLKRLGVLKARDYPAFERALCSISDFTDTQRHHLIKCMKGFDMLGTPPRYTWATFISIYDPDLAELMATATAKGNLIIYTSKRGVV